MRPEAVVLPGGLRGGSERLVVLRGWRGGGGCKHVRRGALRRKRRVVGAEAGPVFSVCSRLPGSFSRRSIRPRAPTPRRGEYLPRALPSNSYNRFVYALVFLSGAQLFCSVPSLNFGDSWSETRAPTMCLSMFPCI